MTASTGFRDRIAPAAAAALLALSGASAADGGAPPDFGTNQGELAFDGVCNDPRFAASDGGDTADRWHLFQDAADCRAAYDRGIVRRRTARDTAGAVAGIDDLGDDGGARAGDGVCNDPRFAPDPRYPEAVEAVPDAEGKDAEDCLRGYLVRQAWPIRPGAGIAFGDDSGEWAGDGECDDPRFTGEAMAGSPGASHILRDAADCEAAFGAGRIAPFSEDRLTTEHVPAGFELGDDSGEWAFDGECDDPRFAGDAVAATLNERDMGRDATDCGKALLAGDAHARPPLTDGFELGDDGGAWARDGVCGDPRFAPDPRYPEAVEPVPEAEGNDAADCLRAYLIRRAWPVDEDIGIAFGDDSGEWASDGECDDPRFTGEAMATSPGASHILRDAADCRAAFEAGRAALFSPALLADLPAGRLPDGFALGDDSGEWAFDGECDDPRFAGDAAAATLNERDTGRDATDCGRALLAGDARIRSLPPGFEAGADDGKWAGNGVCNDPRFAPDPRYPEVVDAAAGAEGKDATDCRRGYLIRRAWPKEAGAGIAFGDDSGEWADDGECDDPRFAGEAMARFPGASHILRDAADCREAVEAGRIALFSEDRLTTEHLPAGFELGDDSGEWAFDGECDDPRFAGDAVAATPNEENARRDATDCGRALLAGRAAVRGGR